MLSKEVAFSDFMDQVESGRVTSVRLDGETIDVLLEGGEQYRVVRPIGNDVVTPLRDNGVKIQAVKQAQSGLMSTISVWLPFILLIGIWIFLMNRMQGGGRGGALGFGKSKAKLLTEKHGRVTFNDVAGILSLIHI